MDADYKFFPMENFIMGFSTMIYSMGKAFIIGMIQSISLVGSNLVKRCGVSFAEKTFSIRDSFNRIRGMAKESAITIVEKYIMATGTIVKDTDRESLSMQREQNSMENGRTARERVKVICKQSICG